MLAIILPLFQCTMYTKHSYYRNIRTQKVLPSWEICGVDRRRNSEQKSHYSFLPPMHHCRDIDRFGDSQWEASSRDAKAELRRASNISLISRKRCIGEENPLGRFSSGSSDLSCLSLRIFFQPSYTLLENINMYVCWVKTWIKRPYIPQ